MSLDREFIIKTLNEIIQVDSPTGYTTNIINKISQIINKLGYEIKILKSGMGVVSLKGRNKEKTVGIVTHVDTLGLMVKSITDKGNLKISKLGSVIFPSVDSENCKIYTRDGNVYTGAIFSTTPSFHVYKDVNTAERNEDTLEVVLDEIVDNKQDVINLGINSGDIIAIDSKTVITKKGFIKSRFLDDKASVAVILSLLKYIKDNNIKPQYNLEIIFSTYEEVGHGTSYIPENIDELIAVDMGCIGKELNGTELGVSICAKDASGPYDYELTSKLVEVAKDNNIKYAIDVYKYYTSDVSVALKSGHNIKGALIGPGVFASHGYERTHYLALENTFELILNYIVNKK